ncbi:MAG TPA: tetratricopeptide repeat protein, partial [Pirellulales bacterium]|nr:tetratricopeptide repeat protein [Pirellulales bacterium]
LANLLFGLGRWGEAATHFERALALKPDWAEPHNSLAIILAQNGHLEQARQRFKRAIALRPDFAEAHNNLGSLFWTENRLDEAAAEYARAIALKPDYAEARANLGNVLARQGRLDEAAAECERAIAVRPDHGLAHKTLADVRLSEGKIDEAAASYERALASNPRWPDAHLGLATCYLTRGDYERGWAAHEWRLEVAGLAARPDLPRWRGESLVGRSLLLVAEQGLGDTIQFARYAREFRQRGARVVLAVQRLLVPLLSIQSLADELFTLGSESDWPRCDYYLPLLSAPAALGATRAIPGDVPYLLPDRELSEAWQRELAAIGGMKIGIAWQGSREYFSDPWRSVPLTEFASLAGLPGVQLVSLQKGFGSEQIATVDFAVIDLAERLDNATGPFMDTAAVIRNLDLVVTSNTAIAHLAGALAAPVSLALHFSPDWRWLQERDDSPWYPTMRIFRQTKFGQWGDVFARIAADVVHRLHEARAE